jgi:hypothetical protein
LNQLNVTKSCVCVVTVMAKCVNGNWNEEPRCRKTRQTSLQSIIPKDVMTSPLSPLTSNRRKICVQFSTGFWQKNIVYEHPVEFSSKKLMRYRGLCIDAQNPSIFFQNVILRQELCEKQPGEWRVRYDRCQRHVANKTCRFLIKCHQIVCLCSHCNGKMR